MTPPISPGPAAAATPSIDFEVAAGLRHGIGDDEIKRFHVRARGDFRHHTAEGGVFAHLRKNDIGQNLAPAILETLDHCRRGLIAGRLDAEDDHGSSFALYDLCARPGEVTAAQIIASPDQT